MKYEEMGIDVFIAHFWSVNKSVLNNLLMIYCILIENYLLYIYCMLRIYSIKYFHTRIAYARALKFHINVTSHERIGVSTHWLIDGYNNSLPS